MSDEKHADDNKHAQRDLKNPKDRDALKRAADDLLKTGKQEPQSDMQQEEEAEETADAGDPAVLAEENAALKDQMLRLAADMENLRRRTARDVADAKAYSVAGFARDMLSVSDDLARALAAIPEGTRDNDPGLKALAEGVEMTERSMMAALERHGVKKIEPEGQKFDPNFHQAIFEVPDASMPSNTVTQVMQAGYIIGDRVLRPAMVGVSKGGQKADEKDGE